MQERESVDKERDNIFRPIITLDHRLRLQMHVVNGAGEQAPDSRHCLTEHS